jgi:hypothetical protein
VPGCGLYPIALSAQSLSGVTVGTVVPNIFDGTQPGNFGWLTWSGNQSTNTLVTSLTPPGNSTTYVNPFDWTDHVVSVGDWVDARPGVTNSSSVRAALNTLETISINVPVWDQTALNGSLTVYHVASFAQVQIVSYQLSTPNVISARFLGYVTCPGSTSLSEVVAPATPTGPASWTSDTRAAVLEDSLGFGGTASPEVTPTPTPGGLE